MFKRPSWILALLLPFAALAEDAPPSIKIGALAFGTLNWELTVIRSQGLDRANGIQLETAELASPEAGRIALQGQSVDLIVSDWIWVARQRQQQRDFSFAPFSNSHGALLTPAGSPIKSLADLAGKRLGVAGGGLDKNWLLLKALAQKTQKLDLEKQATVTFGAPPLLNQSLQQGQLDAVLTYWNYAAKLEAQGFRQLLSGRDIQQGLGIAADVPALGYVFRASWAQSHAQALQGFLKAAATARQRICESDAAWREVAPLTQETGAKAQAALRQHYCDGRVTRIDEAGRQAAEKIFALVNQADDPSAPVAHLPEGVFWPSAGP